MSVTKAEAEAEAEATSGFDLDFFDLDFFDDDFEKFLTDININGSTKLEEDIEIMSLSDMIYIETFDTQIKTIITSIKPIVPESILDYVIGLPEESSAQVSSGQVSSGQVSSTQVPPTQVSPTSLKSLKSLESITEEPSIISSRPKRITKRPELLIEEIKKMTTERVTVRKKTKPKLTTSNPTPSKSPIYKRVPDLLASAAGGEYRPSFSLKELNTLKTMPEIFMTMISDTDSLLSEELDPKKILCNIHDWVLLGTINENFSDLLFSSVEKLIKVHIKKEQEKNRSFNSTILLNYLTALQLRMEAAFLNVKDPSVLTNLPYTELLKKLFGEEVGKQEKRERQPGEAKGEAKGEKIVVKNKKTGYTEFTALSVRDKFIAALSNSSQCEATIGPWFDKSRCWIVDENLQNYNAHGIKISGEDYCPADPGVDCEHIAGLRFQLMHANVVQSGMKRFRTNTDEYRYNINMFYDWSFHGPNVIKNDDEWMEFNKNNGGKFSIAKDGKKFEFEKTLHKILNDATNITNKYGCACINMIKPGKGKPKKSELSKVTQPPNVLRIANRLTGICDKLNQDLSYFYNALPDVTQGQAQAQAQAGASVNKSKIELGVRVYYYMCIFKFLSNIPTLEFINMVTHTANIRNIIEEETQKEGTYGGGIQKGGSYTNLIEINDNQEIYYNLGGTKRAVFENLKQKQEETDKTMNILLYLSNYDIDTIIADTKILESSIYQITNNKIILPSLEPDKSNIISTSTPSLLLEEPIPLVEDESFKSVDDTAINTTKSVVENRYNPEPPPRLSIEEVKSELTSEYGIDPNAAIQLDSQTKQTTEELTQELIRTQSVESYITKNIITRYTREQQLNYETYYYTIKYYCTLKNNNIKYALNLEKRQIEASSRIMLEKRISKQKISKQDANNFYFDFTSEGNPYQIIIVFDNPTVNMNNYRPSEEEIPLNMEYTVTINGMNQSGKVVTLGTNPDTTIFCLDVKKNVIMINTEIKSIKKSFVWTLEELYKAMKGGKKDKTNKDKTNKDKTNKDKNKKNKTKKNKNKKQNKRKSKRHNRKTNQKKTKTIKKRNKKNKKTIKH